MKYAAWMAACLGFISLGCASESQEGESTPAEELDSLSLSGLNETDSRVDDSKDATLEDSAADGERVEDALESNESQWACPETLGAQPNGVTGMVYSCLSIAEGLPYQVIRHGNFETGEVSTRAEIFAPNRLGSALAIRNGWAYFDTSQVDNDVVVSRSIYRFPLGEGEVERVRELTVETFEQTGYDTAFSQTNTALSFALQPGGERIAFHLVDSTTGVGVGNIYSFEVGEELLLDGWVPGAEGAVRRLNWNQDGTKLLFTAGGSFLVAGADLSGIEPLDSAVASTRAAPVELVSSQYTYAGKKTQIRLTNVVGGDEIVKEDLPHTFSKEIEAIFRRSEDELFVVAGDVSLFVLSTMEVESIGELPGFALRHPMAMLPNGEGLVVGGSQATVFRDFAFGLLTVDGENSDPLVSTEKSAGYVSNSVAVY